MKEEKLNSPALEVTGVKGIDAIFDEKAGGIPGNSCYPIFIGILVFIICWGHG